MTLLTPDINLRLICGIDKCLSCLGCQRFLAGICQRRDTGFDGSFKCRSLRFRPIGGHPITPGMEWLCQDHWRIVPRSLKQRRAKLRRMEKRTSDAMRLHRIDNADRVFVGALQKAGHRKGSGDMKAKTRQRWRAHRA